MDLNEIYEMLQNTGYPVAYDHFDTPPTIPFIAYRVTGSNNFDADNEVYFSVSSIDIELYTEKKDLAAEAALENVLAGLCWEKTETYIDTEKLYQIVYEIEV